LSTTASEVPVKTLVADVLLVRYLVQNSASRRVRADVGKLLDSGLSHDQFEAICDELASAGFLAPGSRKQFALTAPGRERALHLLGVTDLPPATKWQTIVKQHLFPKAAGLNPDSAAKLTKGDQLAAFLLRKKYSLPNRAGSTVNQVLQAIVCRKLGFAKETTLEGLLCAVLSNELYSDEKLNKEQLVKQVPLFGTGLKSVSADGIRRRFVQDWLQGPTIKESSPQSEPLDLPAFAATVRALAASSPKEHRFHDNKVFIAPLWRASQREPSFPRQTLSEFKQQLFEANARHLIHLSRADHVQAMDPRVVAESEVTHGNATFHFVLVEDVR
jgi:hypothetical protein